MKSAKSSNSFVAYFTNIWLGITSTVAGMKLTLGYFFKPKVTMFYPEERPEIFAGHRGMHHYVEEKCVLCRACESSCPVGCLAIEAIGKGRDSMITSFSVDYSKCLFCNLCCEACNSECLLLGPEYDLATSSRERCILEFARQKSEEEISAHKEFLAKKEAEKKALQQAKQSEEKNQGGSN